MIRDYTEAAMRRVHYEIIDQPGAPYYSEIPGFDGVLACAAPLKNAATTSRSPSMAGSRWVCNWDILSPE